MSDLNPLLGEKLLTLGQACRQLPGSRGADRKHPATLTRYILRGSRGVGGQVVKLEAIRDGNRWLTSEEALARFFERLAASNPMPATAPRTARERAHAAAEAELERMGA